jgi:hypothetical protein
MHGAERGAKLLASEGTEPPEVAGAPGDGKVAMVDPRDLAEVAVIGLLQPTLHRGEGARAPVGARRT